ncbi:MFS transporter [Paraburkholderia sp. D1E]|uniref:MFS transporter n=1 Tax=Paraburkholderia sp. D1E TaxID=3461398 RepID=UPI004046479F
MKRILEANAMQAVRESSYSSLQPAARDRSNVVVGLDEGHEDKIIRQAGRRLMPFLIALYFCAIVDRGNISFAAVSMNRDIGLSSQMFGFGVGIMFATYALFEVPSNLLLARLGARATLSRIAILWGLTTMLTACATGPTSFYILRAMLGMAEAGLLLGVMLYISQWFPQRYRARYNSIFNLAIPVSYVIAAWISGAVLSMDGVAGIKGWKWLFLLEGLPAVILGIAGLFYLSNRPAEAHWLNVDERRLLERALERDAKVAVAVQSGSLWRALANPTVLILGACNAALYCGLTTPPYWLPQIVHGFKLSPIQTGLVTSIPPLIGLIGMVALG